MTQMSIERAIDQYLAAKTETELDAAYNAMVEIFAEDPDLPDDADFESGVDAMLDARNLPSRYQRENEIRAREIIASGYIVYQIDTGVIYGVGNTADEAWTDAEEWLTDAITDAAFDGGDWKKRCAAVEATAALMQQAQDSGGDIRWTEIEGVACTKAEAGEA
jgi:hypothetical protein